MRSAAWTIVLLLAAAPVVLARQSRSSSAPRVQKFEEVQRGFWLRTNMGFAMSVTDMFGDKRSSNPWPPGPVLQIEGGYDFGQIASIHIALHGQQVVGVREMGNVPDLSNDAALIATMLGGRFNIMTTKRLGWFIKANVGWMFTAPDLAEFDSGLLIQGGIGLEYATMLRHFFVGIEIWASYDISNRGVLVSLTPSLKYTF